MKVKDNAKAQLVNEVEALRQRIAELEASEAAHLRLQTELQESVDKYSTLVEASTHAIALVQDGKVVFANRKFNEILHSRAERQWLIDDISKKMRKKRESYTFEVPFKRGADKTLWAGVFVDSVNYQGRPAEKVYVQDVTEREQLVKELRESENKYRVLFENTGIPTFVIEENTTFSLINAEFKNHFGYSSEDLIGKSWTEFVPQDDLERLKGFHRLRRIDANAAPKSYELGFINAASEVRDTVISIAMIPGTKQSIGSLLDVTERKWADKSLRESEQRYSTIVEGASDGIVIVKDFKIVFANKQITNLTGYTSEEINKQGIANIISTPYLEESLNHYRRRMAGENVPDSDDVGFRHKDGHLALVEFRAASIDYQGGPAVVVFIRDITECRIAENNLRESEEKYSTLVEMSNDGIVLAHDGKIIFANRSFYEMFHHDEANVLGKNMLTEVSEGLMDALSTMPKHDQDMIIRNLTDAMNGKVQAHSYQLPFKKTSGEITWIEVSVTPVEYKGKTSEMVLLRDVTEHIRAEQAISDKNKELETIGDELRQLNHSLEEKVQERTAAVKTLLHQKDEFVNQLGHDLKNPLTPLLTLLPLVEKKEKDPELKELLGIASSNAKHMKELIVKTLELAKLNSPTTKFDFINVNLASDVNGIIADRKLVLSQEGIKIENKIKGNIFVEADRLRLRELIDNLITNATKYSPQGGTLTFNANKSGESIVVSLKDTGMGMTKDQLDLIFSEFYKADTSRKDLDSSGLGLPICKRIIEKHGGRIWAESTGLGEGTTMHFTLKKGDKANISGRVLSIS